MRKIARLIATVFFVGYLPFAPGTATSLLALPIYYAFRNDRFFYFAVTFFLLLLGFWSSNVAGRAFSRKDQSKKPLKKPEPMTWFTSHCRKKKNAVKKL